MKRILAAVLCAALCIGIMSLCGCDAGKNVDSGKVKIAVSIVPEETFVKAVVGDFAEVTAVIPAGYSPETYEPSNTEMRLLEDASVYFGIGVQAEADNILPFIGKNTNKVMLDEAVRAKYQDLLLGSERDPHIWLSPKRVIVMIEKIRDVMCGMYPSESEKFTANAADYIGKLIKLGEEVTGTLKDIECRKFIAFHPAFAYFADEYGLTMYALEEEGKEATSSHLREMIDFAKAEGIVAVFYQAEVDSRQSESFAENIGGKTVMLSPLSADYIENIKTMAKLIAGGGE